MNYFLEALKKIGTFQGRARRKEYWMYVLFITIILISIGIVDFLVLTGGVIYLISCIIAAIGSISVSVRRLHDLDKSGVWYFIQFIPVVGSIWFLVLTCIDGTPGKNRFGENPKLNR